MHSTHITVRGYHLDIYQHVNNARFLEFIEEARWQFFDEFPLVKALYKRDLAFVLVNININYRRPAFVNEVLEIQTRVSRLGSKSANMEQVITLQGTDTVVADATITFCVLDQKTHKSVALEGDIRELLEAMI